MPLDQIPSVATFLGVADLTTGTLIIASFGIAHPLLYGCTLCQSISYLIVTMWLLVLGYCAVSVFLIVGIFQSMTILVTVWIWYTMVFIVVMIVLNILMIFAAAYNEESSRAFCAILSIVWYLFTIYFVFVVNSYRKVMKY